MPINYLIIINIIIRQTHYTDPACWSKSSIMSATKFWKKNCPSVYTSTDDKSTGNFPISNCIAIYVLNMHKYLPVVILAKYFIVQSICLITILVAVQY